jgi:hypothetical protein
LVLDTAAVAELIHDLAVITALHQQHLVVLALWS